MKSTTVARYGHALKLFILSVFAVLAVGCGSAVSYSYDASTGKWRKTRVAGEWGIFTNIIERDIAAELRGAPSPDAPKRDWKGYWIIRCAGMYHSMAPAGTDRDRYIDYIITRRRQVGLAEIPELAKREFPSRLELFKETINTSISMEQSGKRPYTFHETWQEHWKWQCEQTYRDARLGEAAREYIREVRRKAGLPQVQCAPPKESKKTRPF